MLLLLLSSFYVAGQNDSLSHEDLEPLIPLDTFDTCYGVKAKTGFAVRYDQFAQVFFRTEVPSYNTNFVISSNVNPSLNFDIDTLHYGENEPAELLLKVGQADLDESFQLWTMNNCGQTLFLYEVSTSESNSSSVRISRRLFKALGENQADDNLYDVLYNENSVSFPEKLSFVQKYFFKDSLFPSSTQSNQLDTFPVNHKLKRNSEICICHTIVGETEVEPHIIGGPFAYFGHPYAWWMAPFVLLDNVKTCWDCDKSWYRHSLAHIGPARYLDNFSRGFNASGQSTELSVGSVSGGSSSPHYSSLSFRLSCTKGAFAQYCGEACAKKVEYSVKYDTRLVSQAHLRSCPYPFCNKGSRARAEEYAALVLTDYDGNYDLLAAERAGVASEANKSYSQDWFLDILDFAVDVAGMLIGGGDPNALVQTIADLLENAITTNYVTKNGANDQDISSNLIHRSGFFWLQPNVSTELRLISSAYSETAGHTAWTGKAKIFSGYRMSAALLPGATDSEEYCCSDGLSVWSVGNVSGAPINYLSYFSSVESFFNLRSMPYNTSIADKGDEILDFICPHEAPDEEVSADISLRESDVSSSKRVIRSKIHHFEVFDASGRVISKVLNPVEKESNVVQIESPSYPGIYFLVAYYEDGTTEGSKFIVSSNSNQNTLYVQLK